MKNQEKREMTSPRIIENIFIRYYKKKWIIFAKPSKEVQFVFFNCLRILTKTEILSSNSVVIFWHYTINFFIFYYYMFLIFKKIFVMFTFILKLLFFFFFKKILILLTTIFSFLFFFFFRKILISSMYLFLKPLFFSPIIFSWHLLCIDS